MQMHDVRVCVKNKFCAVYMYVHVNICTCMPTIYIQNFDINK